MRYIKKFFILWLVNILLIYITSAYISFDGFNFDYGSWKNLLIVSFGFSIIAILIKPIMKLLALPFIVFGAIFSILFGMAGMYAVALFVNNFNTGGDLKTTLIAGAAFGAINFLVCFLKNK